MIVIRSKQPLVAMLECVRIYQRLDISEIIEYFGHNIYIACTMTQDAPFQVHEAKWRIWCRLLCTEWPSSG